MLLCWLSTFSILPALLMLWDRTAFGRKTWTRKVSRGSSMSRLANLVQKKPRAVVGTSISMVLLGAVLLVWWLPNSFEYDFSKLRNEAAGRHLRADPQPPRQRPVRHIAVACRHPGGPSGPGAGYTPGRAGQERSRKGSPESDHRPGPDRFRPAAGGTRRTRSTSSGTSSTCSTPIRPTNSASRPTSSRRSTISATTLEPGRDHRGRPAPRRLRGPTRSGTVRWAGWSTSTRGRTPDSGTAGT